MAEYPALVPNRIDFDLGRLNLSEQTFLGSGPIRFRHSLRTSGYTLNLIYTALTQAQVEELREHYNTVDGTYNYFTVPASIWGDLTVAATTSTYKYAAPFEEVHTGLHYQVTVPLQVIFGVILLYDLQGGGATQSTITPTPFTSFAFTGNAPFIFNGGAADPDNPAAEFILQGKGADR